MAANPTTYPWAPTADSVARLTPAYTVGGFDDDSEDAGAGTGVFTDTTEPSVSEVNDLIDIACNEIAGRCGVEIPARHYTLATATAEWHVAADIEGGKRAAGTDDASGAYRANILNFRASLD